MKDMVTYDGKKIEYVQIKFEFLNFWQKLHLCWNILTKRYFGLRTSDIEIIAKI